MQRPSKSLIRTLFIFSAFQLLSVAASLGATGLIVARNDAFNSFESLLSVSRTHTEAGRKFVSGTYMGNEVVLTYSPMGKVNNAMTTQILLSRFEIDRVISIAPAGAVSQNVAIGSLVLADEVFQHDFGSIKPYGFIWGKAPDGTSWEEAGYNGHAAAPEPLLKRLEVALGGKVLRGTVVTGDQLVASREKRAWLRDKFSALAVDMSAASIVQTCFANAVPCQIIRVVTDNADETARSDFEASFLPSSKEPDYKSLFKAIIPAEL